MSEVKIKFKTRREYGQARLGLSSLSGAVSSNSAEAAYNAARRIASAAARRAPVDTGRLRDSITSEKVGYGQHKVTVGAPYGIYVEYGTRHMAPEPYFRPAIEEVKEQFLADLRNVFKMSHR